MDITITTSDPESIGAEVKDALRQTIEDLGYYVDLITIEARRP